MKPSTKARILRLARLALGVILSVPPVFVGAYALSRASPAYGLVAILLLAFPFRAFRAAIKDTPFFAGNGAVDHEFFHPEEQRKHWEKLYWDHLHLGNPASLYSISRRMRGEIE